MLEEWEKRAQFGLGLVEVLGLGRACAAEGVARSRTRPFHLDPKGGSRTSSPSLMTARPDLNVIPRTSWTALTRNANT